MGNEISRREAIGGAGAIGALGILSRFFESEALASTSTVNQSVNLLELPALPYPEDALEPVIDKETVRIHHDKHFAGYVAGLNKDLKNLDQARQSGSFESVKQLSRDLAFNASGVVLHWIYFSTIGPNSGGMPAGKLDSLIKRDFGSFDTFWKQFSAASKTVEASGCGVLAWEPFSQKLLVLQAEKHQNLTSWGCMPIMVCDVWEHAYYLKYQNRRAEYVDNFAKIIDWQEVEKRLEKYCISK
jgi:Fe-Mn family superoxide dismutase